MDGVSCTFGYKKLLLVQVWSPKAKGAPQNSDQYKVLWYYCWCILIPKWHVDSKTQILARELWNEDNQATHGIIVMPMVHGVKSTRSLDAINILTKII